MPTPQELIHEFVEKHTLTFGEFVVYFGKQDADNEKDLIEDAKTYQRDGEWEFDDNPVVSRGGDPGAYVMCWRWVYDR